MRLFVEQKIMLIVIMQLILGQFGHDYEVMKVHFEN